MGSKSFATDRRCPRVAVFSARLASIAINGHDHQIAVVERPFGEVV